MAENTPIPGKVLDSEKNYGVDLLRIVSMFYIVMLHTLGMGGVTDAAEAGSVNYFLGTFWEMSLYCALDIFALISGYVGYREQAREYRYGNYLVLWFQVIFTSLAVALVFQLLLPGSVSIKDYLQAVTPVTSNTFWYFTAYTGLFFLVPMLNAGIRASEKETLYKLFAAMIILFSILSTLMNRWQLKDGFSCFWLVILYFMGAIIKKYHWEKRFPPRLAIAGIFLCALLSWGLKLAEDRLPFLSRSLVEATYLTPTHVFSAIFYLILFADFKLPCWLKKFVSFAAPGAFAVYLLNCNPLIWGKFVVNQFRFLGQRSPFELLFTVLGISAGFVIVSVSLDVLRQKLFRLLKVKDYSQKFADGCYKAILWIIQLCKKFKMFHRA